MKVLNFLKAEGMISLEHQIAFSCYLIDYVALPPVCTSQILYSEVLGMLSSLQPVHSILILKAKVLGHNNFSLYSVVIFEL